MKHRGSTAGSGTGVPRGAGAGLGAASPNVARRCKALCNTCRLIPYPFFGGTFFWASDPITIKFGT